MSQSSHPFLDAMEQEDHPQLSQGADQVVDDMNCEKDTGSPQTEVAGASSTSHPLEPGHESEDESCTSNDSSSVISREKSNERPQEKEKEKARDKRARDSTEKKERPMPKAGTGIAKIYDVIEKNGRPMTSHEISSAARIDIKAVQKALSSDFHSKRAENRYFAKLKDDGWVLAKLWTPEMGERVEIASESEGDEDKQTRPKKKRRVSTTERRSSNQASPSAPEMARSVLEDHEKPLTREQVWECVQEKFPENTFQKDSIFAAIRRNPHIFKKQEKQTKEGWVTFYSLADRASNKDQDSSDCDGTESENESECPEEASDVGSRKSSSSRRSSAEKMHETNMRSDSQEREKKQKGAPAPRGDKAQKSQIQPPRGSLPSLPSSLANHRSAASPSHEPSPKHNFLKPVPLAPPPIVPPSAAAAAPEARRSLPSPPLSSFGAHQPEPLPINRFLKPVQMEPPVAPLFPSAGQSSGAAPSLSRPKSPALCDPTKFAHVNQISSEDLQLLMDHRIVEQKMIGVAPYCVPRIPETAIDVILSLPSIQEVSVELGRPQNEVCGMVEQGLLWKVMVGGRRKFFKVNGSYLRGHIPVELAAQKLGFTVQELEQQWALWRLRLFEFCGNKFVVEEEFKKVTS